MLIVISPAKKLDFESEANRGEFTQPQMLSETRKLAAITKKLTANDLKALMGISDKLAELNIARFKSFKTPFNATNARAAIDAFKGDVYVGLDAPTLSDDDMNFAQDHLRILSGFYGLLKPLDLMQAYRLEMGIRLGTERGTNLYHFWDDRITKELNKSFKGQKDAVLVNLASGEYFKAIKPKILKARIVTPIFKEIRGGNTKVISFMAKKARGLMTRYVVENRLENVEQLKNFCAAGYAYDPSLSTEDAWVFTRSS